MLYYFDNAATTAPSTEAIDAFADISFGKWYNPSSTVYDGGLDARVALEDARRTIADSIGANPEQIFFTSGSTEAANWIIQGQIPRGEEDDWLIICSPIEHPCVYNTVKYMESCGVLTRWLSVDERGRVSHEEIAAILLDPSMYKKHVLICVMSVNNETGVIQPVDKIVEMVEMDSEVLFLCDMTQSIAYDRKVNLGVDYAFASAHKFGGFKGCGFLYAKDPSSLRPFMYGGHQEGGLRPGTENVAAIVAMSKALKSYRDSVEQNLWNLNHLKKLLYCELHDSRIEALSLPPFVVGSAPNILSVSFDGVDANKLVAALNMDGFALSAGSACSTGENKPSRILKAMMYSDEKARQTVRISFEPDTKPYEVKLLVDSIRKHIEGGICKLE
jgi:cysteine desulfurase